MAERRMSSEYLLGIAKELMPGGVSSPVRAFGAVGGNPRVIASGSGCRITDEDGRTYIDMVGSWGPLIVGHAHKEVVAAIKKAASRGTSFGAPTAAEITLAETIVGALPSVEMVRFVNSGTEATMSALRLARAATGRTRVLKFAGCYHGHVDGLLVSAGSGPATLGLPDSPGVPASAADATIVAAYNSIEEVDRALDRYDDIAAVIVEPVAANMGVVPPTDDFLSHLRKVCTDTGALLIFDEVVTGFRVGWQGAQGMFGVMPDLTILGKIIGGGMPVGAYGGRRDLMEMVAPSGPVYQAGTLSGNPVSMAAGSATLDVLNRTHAYPHLERSTSTLATGIESAAKRHGAAVTVQQIGSMMTVFFTDSRVEDLDAAKRCDTAAFARFFHAMLDEGVYWPPSQFEAAFVGLAHNDADIQQVIEAADRAFERIK